MAFEPKSCVCGKRPELFVELHHVGDIAASPRGRYGCVGEDHVIYGPWAKGYPGMEFNDPGLMKACCVAWNGFAGWQSLGTETEVENLAELIQFEARERGGDSPVDYGDAEQLARVAIAHLRPTIGRRPVAWLKRWLVPGDPVERVRVDLSETHERWLDTYSPTIIPLGMIEPPIEEPVTKS